jgi:hypothetical protein
LAGFQEDSMKRLPIAAAVVVTLAAPTVLAQNATIHARLSGYNETPSTISTAGTGAFKAKIVGDSIEYELSYEDLQGNVTQAHIHFGQAGLSGGIAAWLCGNANPPAINPPTGTPLCPGPNTGSASGVITAAQVVGPAGQGISPGEFDALLAAIKEGAAYVNVHTTFVPGGEIRGQIK